MHCVSPQPSSPFIFAHATIVRVLLWAVRATEHLAFDLRGRWHFEHIPVRRSPPSVGAGGGDVGFKAAAAFLAVDAVAAAAFSLMLSLVPENVVDAF